MEKIDGTAKDGYTIAQCYDGRVNVLAFNCHESSIMSDIHISADGRYLYGACRGGGVINAYAIGDDGLLKRLQSLKLEGEAPRGFEISPDGRFLLVADPEAGTISTVAIGPDGRLSLTGIIDRSLGHPAPIVFYRA